MDAISTTEMPVVLKNMVLATSSTHLEFVQSRLQSLNPGRSIYICVFSLQICFIFHLLYSITDAAKENDKTTLFTEIRYYPDLEQCWEKLKEINQSFLDELSSIRQILQKPQVEFRTLQTGINR